MPQHGPRSVVYKSFFYCDDPKGIVECTTNRKSKTDSLKLEDKVEGQKKKKNSSLSFSFKEERKDAVSKGPTDHELLNPSSYQLMEISRGAKKLNQVVDSRPRDKSFDRQTKDIAEELLRGALDLKESLAMLGKLHEASQIMANLKKKQKEKARGGNIDGMGLERTTSERFGYQNQYMLEFQKPRLSVDGSSRDCFEELREVIRESFARQNLLPKASSEEKAYSVTKTSNEEKAYLDRIKSDFSLDLPSTSSSQSSMFHSHEFDTSSDFSLSKSIEEKPKVPSVIAKLMGLEAIPPKPLESNPQRHYGKEKALNQGRTTFDIDLPTAGRPCFTVRKVDPQPRMLDKVTDNIQFKGLVKSMPVDGPEHLSNASDWKKRFAYDASPIVIIKPLHVSGSLEKELLRQKYRHQDLDTKKMHRKWKMKEGLPPRPNYDWEGALNFSEIHRKLRAEKAAVKRPIQERGDNDFGDAFAKKDDKSVNGQENLSSTTVKASVQVKPKVQKKEVTKKTVPKIQRVVVNTRRQIEVETEKIRDTSKSRYSNKLASTTPRTPDKESNVSKVRVSLQKASTSGSVSGCNTLTTSQRSSVWKKNVKNEKGDSEPSTILVERKSKNVNITVKLGCDTEPGSTTEGTRPSEQLPGDEKKDTSGNLDKGNNSRNFPCESTNPIQPNNEIRSMDDVGCGIRYNLTEMKSCKRSNTTRNLLLDSSSFLNHAEELFETHACQPIMSHITGLHDYGTADTKLLIECAKELLEHKSFQCRVAVDPLARIHIKLSKTCISLDRLINEICDGIEYLRSYCKLARKTIVVDSLSAMLQNDMWCKGMVNGTWDFGWRNGFTLDEIDQVVVDIEQKIWSGILEDVLTDMVI
ncbi:hypothetical protein ACH5RR_004200 [Cinchona calisaya]|uniref:DUF3741 domain-containing protein n=1 Tax=Cinchona calisaya TaxID=153742 RepID=A0ABD3AWX8_9GENT